ncbi:hypothetical protein HYH03_007755 [Edaphochlamys debaryana]|uniref:Uncharacterized protein n=1 Tax=Edaphochlamys debaryana TaxID=47281 RepID=A0A835XZY1_9CHLO|nr:hypothetical protein HYH03_007755 [Edaphochlamys debaryana]|eukprot:KAG2494117.1 hypothetical protein HYH03_007755 [Edaphochlamys debaryana]
MVGHQIRSTIPAQYWGTSVASASAADGALASSISDPAPLPLLAGSGLSRPHLVLATQALKLPGKPGLPGLPSLCQGQGGVVLDRVLAHLSGEQWWAALSGRARLGRLLARRSELTAALTDPSSYSLCASSRVQLRGNAILRSRLDWSPPATAPPPAAAATGEAHHGLGAAAARLAAPLSMSATVRSYVGSHTEARADVAIAQRTAASPHGGVEAVAAGGGGGGVTGGGGAVTPLVLGLQAGSAPSCRSALQWRCGALQVTAPPTVPLAGAAADAGGPVDGPALQSALYLQGTVAMQGEHFLWRAPKRPPPRRRAKDEAGAAGGEGGDAAAAAPAPPPPAPPRAPSIGPHNPVRQVASRLLNRLGDKKKRGGSGDEEDDAPVGAGEPDRVAAGAARRRHAASAKPAAANGAGKPAGGAAGAGKAGGEAAEAPFGVELPSANEVQEALVDATQSLARLRDDVTQASRWVASGGLAEKLEAAGAPQAGAGAARAKKPAKPRKQPDRPVPWSAFIGEPHLKVAGVAGLTARAPALMLTHGSRAAAAGPDAGSGSGSRSGPLSAVLPVRIAWIQDLGARRARRAIGGFLSHQDASQAQAQAQAGPEGPGLGPAPAAAAAHRSGGASSGALRPFASAAANAQFGRFAGWLGDYTRLGCQLDAGLWGPGVQAASGSSASPRQRHPAFALGDTGAWHALSVSLSQQLIGPLRFAADWRYELVSARALAVPPPPPPPRAASGGAAAAIAAGAAGAAAWLPGAAKAAATHVGGMRPQLLESVYALDLAVPGTAGAARVVAWYAPQRREGMVELRLLDAEASEAGYAIDTVVQALQKVPGVKVDRVKVGGSFGRKTSVKGRFDVDLSVFVNGLDPELDPQRAAEALNAAAAKLNPLDIRDVHKHAKACMIQFTLQDVKMDVVLVPNFATHVDSHDRDNAAKQVEVLVKPLLRMTGREAAATTASGLREQSLSEALTKFVKKQHKTANEAVRLFKAWVKCGLAERGLLRSSKLPSVALELIVLQAFQAEQAARGSEFDPIGPDKSLLLRTFLGALDTASRLDEPGGGPVVMLDAGGLGYRREQGERFRACWGPGEGPFIIHPIDPTCNVARAPGDGRPPWDWPTLAQEARKLRSCGASSGPSGSKAHLCMPGNSPMGARAQEQTPQHRDGQPIWGSAEGAVRRHGGETEASTQEGPSLGLVVATAGLAALVVVGGTALFRQAQRRGGERQ